MEAAVPSAAAAAAAPKAKATKKAAAPKKEAAPPAEEEAEKAEGDEEAVAEEAKRAAVGSGRQAAQGKAYKEKSAGGRASAKDEYIVVAEEAECVTEALALEQTSGGAGIKRRCVHSWACLMPCSARR